MLRLITLGCLVTAALAFTARAPPSAGHATRIVSTRAAGGGQEDAAAEEKRVGAVVARVVFVTGGGGSGFGATSPQPNPRWAAVGSHLAERLPNFAVTPEGRVVASSVSVATSLAPFAKASLEEEDEEEAGARPVDVVVALGVASPDEEARFAALLEAKQGKRGAAGELGFSEATVVLADPSCGEATRRLQRAGRYHQAPGAAPVAAVAAALFPWTAAASGKRLLGKAATLLGRRSSEDAVFAVLFALHATVISLDVVKSDINPSWEKGFLRNVKEFRAMADCCLPTILAALRDPQTKRAIDLLNAVDLRDQVGSYRVIVSNETPQLEEFTRCILQQNNCFGCDAPILDAPRVPLLASWRGAPLTAEGAAQILVGHLDHPAAAATSVTTGRKRRKEAWSWKIVVGANPAYDAFPLQHQIFYPPNKPSQSLWYDPVFCVETLDGDRVWCKRHYRCTPRNHWSSASSSSSSSSSSSPRRSPGAWTLTTLDNGMVSEEHWTLVDCADDLSWCVLHYSGAAKRAGQSYVGALLCSPDGQWPESAKPHPDSQGQGEGGASGSGDLARIEAAFKSCDLELWELYGSDYEQSYMWSEEQRAWAEAHPPPLERIGDISITRWRQAEREKELAK